MQNIALRLETPVYNTFRCQKAANSLDIDVNKKSVHEFSVNVDLESPYNIGLILGASGSGKTTLAQKIWGKDCFKTLLKEDQPILEQFPKSWSYEDCQKALSGMGLTSVPCWIRNANTLSNGQKARAEAALQLSNEKMVVIDEWTSVVDRTVAKAMSNCIKKHVKRTNKTIVLLSCHYDILEWLDPDWVIDCNKQKFKDRRCLRQRSRKEKLQFQIRKCDRSSWKYFSKYHYLSDKLPGGHIELYGLYDNENQIGFQCFANYTPRRSKSSQEIMHSNRTVIHPDYVGLGLSLPLINHTSADMARNGYNVKAKFSSIPIHKLFQKSESWTLIKTKRDHKIIVGGNMLRDSGFRKDTTCFIYDFNLSNYNSEYSV